MSDNGERGPVFDTAFAVAFALQMHARVGVGGQRSRRLLLECGHEAATVASAAVIARRELDAGAALELDSKGEVPGG